jgi:hypothetical protein
MNPRPPLFTAIIGIIAANFADDDEVNDELHRFGYSCFDKVKS